MKHTLSISTALLLPVLAALHAAEPANPATKPNIVLMVADDLGYGDLGCYGCADIPTPRIDSLARDGLRFVQAYNDAPVCTPSRYAILTGKHNQRGGMTGALTFDAFKPNLSPKEVTLATALKKLGYDTAIVGKWHLGHKTHPLDFGFDYFYGHVGGLVDYFTHEWQTRYDWWRNREQVREEGYSTDLLGREAAQWIGSRKPGTPFFLYLPFNAVHYAQVGGKPGKNDLLQAKDSDIAKFAGIKNDLRRTYAAMAACMDENAGRVLDALEKSGAASNTIVLFLSDNGGSLPWGGTNGALKGKKGQYYEGGLRTPLLMRWPGHFQAGRTVDEPIVSVDLFPTLLGYAGGSTNGLTLDGIDIRSLLAAEGEPPQRDLYWAHALRRGDWKFVRNKGKAELFNLKNDPGETKNLSDQNPELFNELQKAHEAMAASIKTKR